MDFGLTLDYVTWILCEISVVDYDLLDMNTGGGYQD